jgi:hypothetical protein
VLQAPIFEYLLLDPFTSVDDGGDRRSRHRRAGERQSPRSNKWLGKGRFGAPKADAPPGCAIPRRLDFCGLSGIGHVSQVGTNREFGGQFGMPGQWSPGIVPEFGSEKSRFAPYHPRLCALGWFPPRVMTSSIRARIDIESRPARQPRQAAEGCDEAGRLPAAVTYHLQANPVPVQ